MEPGQFFDSGFRGAAGYNHKSIDDNIKPFRGISFTDDQRSGLPGFNGEFRENPCNRLGSQSGQGMMQVVCRGPLANDRGHLAGNEVRVFNYGHEAFSWHFENLGNIAGHSYTRRSGNSMKQANFTEVLASLQLSD